MPTTPAPDFGDHLRQYRAQIVWGSLAMFGLLLPRLSVFLEKSGEGWAFHNLAVILFLIVGWFLLTIVVVTLGAPFHWTLIIGIAPAVSSDVSGILDIASEYADAGYDFWNLLLTGDGQVIQALVLQVRPTFAIGIPSALIAYVIGRTLQDLDEGRHERLSWRQSILLVALAVLSLYIASLITRRTSMSVLFP